VSVRLDTFRFIGRQNDGWETPLLSFGALLTALQGPNGTGKTPLVKGIMQALGHEIELPPEILQHCVAAELRLLIDGSGVLLTRFLGSSFRMRVDEAGGSTEFQDQAAYARWFTELLGGEARTVTNKSDAAAELYANVIIPAFAVDQDHGWDTDYYVPRSRDFIKNQRQEVIRFLMGVPARHPFRAKTDFEDAKTAAEKVDKSVELQRYVVDRLRTDTEFRDGEQVELRSRLDAIRAELEANTKAVEAIRDLTSFYERDISTLEGERDALRANANDLSRQKGQLTLVLSELEGEVEILGANVQATDLFRQFCSRDDCSLFATAEQSYGRSLLYLKDQIKDLRNSADDIGQSVTKVGERVAVVERAIAVKQSERAARLAASPQAHMIERLDSLTEELVEVELRVAKLQQYEVERAKFERLLDRRTQTHELVEALRPRGGRRDADAAEDVRQQLTASMQHWIETLRTQNTRTAGFDDDFVVQIDGAKFSTDTHHSGSTRARIVLAFHAALLEVALARGGNHPGWLILDAPKQHELNQEDFDAYVERLKVVAARYPGRVQIVFSVADLRTQLEATDEVWMPAFTNEKGEPRFLGPRGK
jgi:hypothetical protein